MRTLQLGMRGPDVASWQAFLKSQQLDLGETDSKFGDGTAHATKIFQQLHGLVPDGKAGKLTLAKAATLGLRTLRRISNSEVTPAISAAAKAIIKQHHQAAYGSEFPFDADGQKYVARIEEHYHPPGGPIKP